ncbi:methyltransferase domain-containing protein [Microbacteriaceae bacterium VKM Ac-2855]|nr:methyltransferase domain-containing protein [Microbacteriaceae bacterium VKM Ac-2855]
MTTADDRWSPIAEDWARDWGSLAEPARHALIGAAGIRAGMDVLDVGCGSGEFLAELGELGACASGIEPAEAMRRIARARAPRADVRAGSAEDLPWPNGTFDVVTAVNSLELADDLEAAVVEAIRVLRPGGRLAVANWAERERNDLDALESAVAAADGAESPPDGDVRVDGGWQRMLSAAGLDLVAVGEVEAPWSAASDDALIRGVLLGEDASVQSELAPVVVAAALPFRATDGGYRFHNVLRFAVGRRPS